MADDTSRGAPPGRVETGTSGWSYPHWRGTFYPDDLPAARWLEYYTGRFSTVEVNATHYGLPSAGTVEGWAERAPAGFTYAVKMSRLITHSHRLRGAEELVRNFLDRVAGLGPHLGPVLVQLPPRFPRDRGLLTTFLETLRACEPSQLLPGAAGPASVAYSFEFRDLDWLHDDVFDLLERHDAAFCIYHLAGYETPHVVTSRLAYVRLHGPAGAYAGRYGERPLRAWAAEAAGWAAAGHDVRVYFDNDQEGAAPRDAETLRRLLERRRAA
jgi:uncharacterized protein YecE (DUF72 family)